MGDHLITMRLPSGRRRLMEPLTVKANGLTFDIPAGFETDYSSIPAAARWLVRWDRVDIAGVVHDYLYKEAPYGRRRADQMWRRVATRGDHHANWVQATLGYYGLRVGGWWAWRKHRAND